MDTCGVDCDDDDGRCKLCGKQDQTIDDAVLPTKARRWLQERCTSKFTGNPLEDGVKPEACSFPQFVIYRLRYTTFSGANMTVVLECLKLIPVPYVAPALAVFSAIWKAVIAVQERKAQFVILAETAATLIITLDKQYRENKLSPGSTAETLDEMDRYIFTS